jgi:nucleotide-binding universal stress UspA family protein
MSQSILVALDGSQESLFAADIAASLAKRKQAGITGMTVVDTQALWEIAGQDLPGIIGSGPYIVAYQLIESSLRSVAETLMVAFESRVADHCISTQALVDEGDIVEHILKRAEHHGIVVMGHKSRSRRHTIHKRRYFHSSICQLVADSCPVPLLIVQGPAKLWDRSTLLLSAETYNSATMKAFVDFALSSGVQAQIVCTGRSKTIDEMIKVVQADIDRIMPNAPITLVGKRLYELEKFFSSVRAGDGETLFVLTTCDTEQGRKVCTGESLDYVIRDVARAYTLFLPPTAAAQTSMGGRDSKVEATISG